MKWPTWLSCIVLLVLFASCKKDAGILETQLVVTKTDRSIAALSGEDYDIITFDVCSENDIFAVAWNGYDVRLFKSANGGVAWEELPDPIDYWNSNVDEVQAAVYLDVNNLAFIANNKVYRSFDGGSTWSVVSNGFQPMRAFFAGKTAANELVLVENNSSTANRVMTAQAGSALLTQVGSCPAPHFWFNVGHLNDNFIAFVSHDEDYSNGEVYGFNLETHVPDTFQLWSNAYDYPNDALPVNGTLLLVRNEGKLNTTNDTYHSPNAQDYLPSVFHNYHDNDYYSAETMGSYFVAVGDRTITTDYTGEIREAINPDVSAHTEVFRKVKKASATHFYAAGNDGVFIKATFQ